MTSENQRLLNGVKGKKENKTEGEKESNVPLRR